MPGTALTALTALALALLPASALAQRQLEGADVSFYSEYVVTPPGRETGLLTTARTCTPEGSTAAPRCQNGAMLAFELE